MFVYHHDTLLCLTIVDASARYMIIINWFRILVRGKSVSVSGVVSFGIYMVRDGRLLFLVYQFI